jgi:hypothetical protein
MDDVLGQAKETYALFDQWPVSVSRRQSPVCASRAPVARPDQALMQFYAKHSCSKLIKIKSCVIC